jgi:hypothetical protein
MRKLVDGGEKALQAAERLEFEPTGHGLSLGKWEI